MPTENCGTWNKEKEDDRPNLLRPMRQAGKTCCQQTESYVIMNDVKSIAVYTARIDFSNTGHQLILPILERKTIRSGSIMFFAWMGHAGFSSSSLPVTISL
jgi:hypothetical protein